MRWQADEPASRFILVALAADLLDQASEFIGAEISNLHAGGLAKAFPAIRPGPASIRFASGSTWRGGKWLSA